jgi:hypothetical protein
MGYGKNSSFRKACFRKTWVAAPVLVLFAIPALAQGIDLRGVWQYSRVNARGDSYSGNINIDGNSQASDVTRTPLGTVAQTGYVTSSGGKVEIVFTKAVRNGPSYNPDHFYCTVQSAQAMSCSNTDVAGSSSSTFAVLRVGQTLRK